MAAPSSSTASHMAIWTSQGFTQLPVSDYISAVHKLKPDVAIGLADLPSTLAKLSRRRISTMTERTTRWMRDQVSAHAAPDVASQDPPAIFAPILPVAVEMQSAYLSELVDHMLPAISGLALYDSSVLPDLPPELQHLPRLAITEPKTPQRLLLEIARGVDLFTIPFLSAITDAGVALDFSFPPPAALDGETAEPHQPGSRPLGTDLWPETHATSLTPLRPGCTCHACMNYHRAYLRHLLAAKEMLGWVLLQIHNHHVMDEFFAGVRSSIGAGTFEADVAAFEAMYESELPVGSGSGPR